ncbi:MAG: hypothetical protein Q4G40_08800, partial [Brachybacterium sp.]|nr:hypothetical protein [Brachybacterium sp.]
MTFTDAMAPVAALALLFAGIVLLMWLGWRARRRAQADVPAPAPDADLADRPGGLAHRDVPAVYVATTRAERPLERIVAHGLGVRSPASLDLA